MHRPDSSMASVQCELASDSPVLMPAPACRSAAHLATAPAVSASEATPVAFAEPALPALPPAAVIGAGCQASRQVLHSDCDNLKNSKAGFASELPATHTCSHTFPVQYTDTAGSNCNTPILLAATAIATLQALVGGGDTGRQGRRGERGFQRGLGGTGRRGARVQEGYCCKGHHFHCYTHGYYL